MHITVTLFGDKEMTNKRVKIKSSLATKLMQKMVIGGNIVSAESDGSVWVYRTEKVDGKDYPFYEKLDIEGNRVDMTFSEEVSNAKE